MPDGAEVALITGGGSGIGRSLAALLRARGMRVAVVDLDAAAAEETARAVDGIWHVADVSEPESNHEAVAFTVREYGRLDVVALNVGINSGQRAHLPLDPVRYRRTVAVNVDSVVFGVEAATPAMIASGGGSFLVTASLAALAPEVSNPVYALTKSAVAGYIRAMAPHLGVDGIRINAVCPAFVDTPMLGKTREPLTAAGFPLIPPADVAAALTALLDSPDTGGLWAMVPGTPPTRYVFPELPPSRLPDGSPPPPFHRPLSARAG